MGSRVARLHSEHRLKPQVGTLRGLVGGHSEEHNIRLNCFVSGHPKWRLAEQQGGRARNQAVVRARFARLERRNHVELAPPIDATVRTSALCRSMRVADLANNLLHDLFPPAPFRLCRLVMTCPGSMLKAILLRSGLLALVSVSCVVPREEPKGIGGSDRGGVSGQKPSHGGTADNASGGAPAAGGGGVPTSGTPGNGDVVAGVGGVAGVGSVGSVGGVAGAGAGGEAQACPFGSSEYFLWAGTAPGSAGVNVVEKITDSSTNPAVQSRQVSGVTKPSIFAYLAKNPTGAAAIVLPGGGYTYLAFDHEGVDVAKWLNSQGISAFVLKYRLPGDFAGTSWIALADAQRALRTVRHFAGACGVEPGQIGVVGFSAGGHLASQLETRFSAQTSPLTDAIDAVDARPAFGVLMYPVISMDSTIAHARSKKALLGDRPSAADVTLYSSEKQVTGNTPATFIGVSSKDTNVQPENSLRFADALKAAGVAHELHVYQDGRHGTGLIAPGDMGAWPEQCAAWLATMR
jgi:acetyl esterase/lipase